MGWHWSIKLYIIDFGCIILQHIIRILYCVFTTPSQVSFHHHLPSLFLLLLPPHSFPSGNHHTVVCVWVVFLCFCLTLHHFHPAPQTPSPLTAVSLLYLCVCFYFVSLFCSLDSTYKWNHAAMPSFFLVDSPFHWSTPLTPFLGSDVGWGTRMCLKAPG